LGAPDWPDEAAWRTLRDADRLEELEPAREVTADGGHVDVSFTLPMPSVSLLELVPIP
jgi:xylan 1,4-beta-xylosidase